MDMGLVAIPSDQSSVSNEGKGRSAYLDGFGRYPF